MEMSFKRDDNERLNLDLENRKQVVKEQDTKIKSLEEEIKRRSAQIDNITRDRQFSSETCKAKIQELELTNQRLQQTNSLLEEQIRELRLSEEHYRTRIPSLQQAHDKEIQTLKDEVELTRSDYTSKIKHLEENLNILKQNYHIDETVSADREQLIRDTYKETKSKSKETPSVRGVLLQNQQLTSQLEYQSQQIVVMLEKIQKNHEHLVHLRRENQIQKQVEVDLVKRSTGTHSLLKQFTVKTKDLELQNQTLRRRINESVSRPAVSEQPSNSSKELLNCKTQMNLLSVECSKLRNEINYLQNKLRLHETKYEGLASILTQYLEGILMNSKDKNSGIFGESGQAFELNLTDLRNKDVMDWKQEETVCVVYLLLTQLRHIISKKNLISLPEVKNPNVSIIEESQSKDPISLPKINSQYEELSNLSHQKPSRFRGIPLDISTKIVRSELRTWGTKVVGSRKNQKSLSLYTKNHVSYM